METLTSFPTSSTTPSSGEAADMGPGSREHMYSCSAEEVADAKLTTRRETLLIIESLTQEFLRAIANGDDPELHLVNIYMYFTSVCLWTCVDMCRLLARKGMCFVIPKVTCTWAGVNLSRSSFQRMALELRDMQRVSS